MERFGDDSLAEILKKVDCRKQRRACSLVNKQWNRVEAITRTSLKILKPQHLLTFFPKFSNLITLEVCTMISNQHLEYIARMCPRLKTLYLKLCLGYVFGGDQEDFGDDGLCAIANGCSQLTKVRLGNREGFSDFGIITLVRNAKSITSLELSSQYFDNKRITDDSLEAIGEMTSLTGLYLLGCSMITRRGLHALANGSPAKTLRVLHLKRCNKITNRGLGYLRKMSCLWDFSFADYGMEFTEVGAVCISKISTLRRLDISGMRYVFRDAFLALSQTCHNLEVLVIRDCHYGEKDDVGMVALEALVLGCNSLRYVVVNKSLMKKISPSLKEEFSNRGVLLTRTMVYISHNLIS